jgi:hypothetical protein
MLALRSLREMSVCDSDRLTLEPVVVVENWDVSQRVHSVKSVADSERLATKASCLSPRQQHPDQNRTPKLTVGLADRFHGRLDVLCTDACRPRGTSFMVERVVLSRDEDSE